MAPTSRMKFLGKRLPLSVAATLVGLGAQGYYAGHRTLPHFLDQDASGRFGTPGNTRIRLAAIGDSTLTGPGLLGPEELWLRQVIERLPPAFEIDLHILAQGGAWTRDVRKNQVQSALELRPDIAIVAGGSNDSIRGVPLRSIHADLQYMAGALVEVASTVILAGVGDMGSIPRLPQPLATALRWRSRAADRVHARVASTHPRIIHLPMWEEGSEPFRQDSGLFAPDLFHPNVDGQAVWANVGYPVISAACHRVASVAMR